MQDKAATSLGTSNLSPAIRRIIHEREACCVCVEELCQRCDIEAGREFDTVCRKWQMQDNAPEEFQELLEKRFEQACDNFRGRLEQLKKHASERAERVDKLEWLCVESAKLCAAESEVLSRKKLRQMRNDWDWLCKHTADIDVLQKKFEDNYRCLEERVSALEASRKQAAEEIKAACHELEQIIAQPNQEQFRERKSELDGKVEAALSLLGDNYQADNLRQDYQRLTKKYSNHLHQLYQVRDLARWEHYTLKLDLCDQLDKLLEVDDTDLPKAAKKLKHLRAAWQDIGSVPHEKSEEIWLRFKTTCDRLQQRISEYFDALAVRREQVAQEKIKLCEEAESNRQREDWREGTARFKMLQQRWREVGFAHPEQEKLLYQRFRDACDYFFNARAEYYRSMRDNQAEATAIKLRLCDEAEKLLELPYGDSHRRVPLLWQRWKEAGSAGRDDHQLYERFKKSFDLYYDSLRKQRNDSLDVKLDLLNQLEKLQNDLGTIDPKDIDRQYRRLLSQWRDAGPVPHANEEEMMEKFRQLTSAVDEHLGSAEREKKRTCLSRHLQVERIMSEALAALLAGNHSEFGTFKERWHELALPEKGGAEHEFSRICRLSAEADSNEASRFARQAEENLRQRKIICLELEKITGTSSAREDDKTLSPEELAEELSLAITSNFTAHRDTKRPSEKEIGNMIARWFECGVVPLAELEPVYERFGRVLEQLDLSP